MPDIVSSLVLGFTQLFTVDTFGLMSIGIFIGFLIGILPGLGGPTALALMLPFIVTLTPVQAFAFLLGMSSVTSTTGDITSVLIGIPGEPTTAATIVDGHPMAKKGEAGRALGAVLMSSLVGAVFGSVALALAIPIVRPLVLGLNSPEFFMLSVLGLSFVAALSGENILKGLISAGIGLLFSMVGLDQVSGTERYTFGQTFLWDGVGLVPMTIGFFAIPEVIALGVQGSSIAGGRVTAFGVMQGVKDTFHHWWMVIRCSAIGAFISIIPGMGSATTQWLAYAHAVQSSKGDKQRFGQGAIEGVLGPGAANNSTLGGSLITTIAFGVPGSLTMAILLGAFIIQGIVPGPAMLIPEPKGHLALTFSFVWINVISNLITVGLCFLILKQLVKVTQVRGELLIPSIILLIYLGAFAEKNAFEDLYLVMFFGLLGWTLERFQWPRPPMILGLVLGSLAENRFFLSVDNYGIAWLFRPGVMVLILLTLVGVLYPVTKAILAHALTSRRRKASFAFDWNAVFTGVVALTLVAALWESRNFDFRARLFPSVVGFPVLFLVAIQLAIDLFGNKSETRAVNEGAPTIPPNVENRRTLQAFGWLAMFFAGIWLLGFSIGGTLCTFIQLRFGSREKWPLTIALTALAWGLTYGVFDLLLHVPFPPGQLLVWLQLAAQG